MTNLYFDLLVERSSMVNPISLAKSVASDPTSSVWLVCSITLRATDIADLTLRRQPTEPTS